MSTPLLQVSGLAKHFRVRGGGVVRAVEDVSFALEHGRALALVGESGCGKSTVARCLLGLARPTAGSIALDGVELARLSPRARRAHGTRMQIVFQDPYASLDPRQSVMSILAEPLVIEGQVRERERKLRMLGLLEAVGLDMRCLPRFPHELSGGQRQRVAIARALMLEPEVLVCDEPTSALDVSVRAQVINLLAELKQRIGLALLVISHDLAVVRHLCDSIAVMYCGRIVESAPSDELLRAPRHPYTRALLSAVPSLDRAAARERIVLGGEIPSPRHPPSGCSFHPRCPERARVPGERCARERPQLHVLGNPPLHGSACHLDDGAMRPA